ncbi:hypothetical protein CSUI_007847 [Cystoisospora suis]|uniref:Uncharacterized protein n=1 Tax=Cystoisospora suis TaxID=483139 RepID=A0A2C6KL95_9APIC|nr:hypothetical protein CSUI_007847 [Cystoisospora suis]
MWVESEALHRSYGIPTPLLFRCIEFNMSQWVCLYLFIYPSVSMFLYLFISFSLSSALICPSWSHGLLFLDVILPHSSGCMYTGAGYTAENFSACMHAPRF